MAGDVGLRRYFRSVVKQTKRCSRARKRDTSCLHCGSFTCVVISGSLAKRAFHYLTSWVGFVSQLQTGAKVLHIEIVYLRQTVLLVLGRSEPRKRFVYGGPEAIGG